MFDPFEGDDLLSDVPDLAEPEPSQLVQQLLIQAAIADMDQHLARLTEPEPVAEPTTPRQVKRAQRRRLFAALRYGHSRVKSCELAGIAESTFRTWMERPKFAAAVDGAEAAACAVLTTDDFRRW